MRSVVVVTCGLLAVCRPLLASGSDGLVQAAGQRHEGARSLVVGIEVKEFVPKGRLEVTTPKTKAATSVPPVDTEIRSRNQLTIDGKMMRYENNHPLWTAETGALVRTTQVIVTDGEVGKQYFPTGIAGNTNPRGIIWAEANPPGLRPTVLTPLTTHFRGLSTGIAPYPLSSVKRTDRVLTLDRHPCVEYAAVSDPDRPISLFVDEKNQFVVRRIQKLHRGNVQYQLDVRYRQHDTGLVPEHWAINEFDAKGLVKSTTEVDVVDLQINPVVPRSDFDIQYPQGCEVYDQRTRSEYRIQPDGMMRELSDAGAETGTVVSQPGASWLTRNRGVLLWAGVGIITAVVALLVWRRRPALKEPATGGGSR